MIAITTIRFFGLSSNLGSFRMTWETEHLASQLHSSFALQHILEGDNEHSSHLDFPELTLSTSFPCLLSVALSLTFG